MRSLILSWWLILVALHVAVFSTSLKARAQAQCLEDQRDLLQQMKRRLNFSSVPSTKLRSWTHERNCCRWEGVTCDAKGRVIGLDLSTQSITAGVDDSSPLFHLRHLQTLNLSLNSFNFSQIPSRIGEFPNLVHLNLSNSGFGGQIPAQVSNLTLLETLDLSTLFSGIRSLKLENPNLGSMVQNLRELRELYLDGVNVSADGHQWCEALSSSLPNLRVLSMSNSYLSGPIHPSLLKMEHLETIRLDNNGFSTSVPDFFGELKHLVSLRMSHCSLSGRLPGKIFQLSMLQTLDLSQNPNLTGTFTEFPQHGSMRNLILSNTGFSGKLPESMGNLEMLSTLSLAACNFSGEIPRSMASLRHLAYVDLSSNKFEGSVPSFAMSNNLTRMILFNNSLSGVLLPTYGESFNNLQDMDMRDNKLNGSIPPSLFSLPSLRSVLLSNNKFAGQLEIPGNVSSSGLNALDLSGNSLQGHIPMPLFAFKGLNVLSLASNNFTGSLDLGWFRNLTNLSSLDLSHNNLSVFHQTGDLSRLRLRRLRLAACGLKGFPDLRGQSKLVFLDLSKNRLNGEVPNWVWSLGDGSLLHLNVSQNLLTGFEEDYRLLSLGLSVLDLRSNMFSGSLPLLPPFAQYLDFSNNNFSSSIPDDIGTNLSFSIYLSLSSNNLTGSIPSSMCKAEYLQVLDFSNNKLSGKIPQCLMEKSSKLGVLNLRGNNLEGRLTDSFAEHCAIRTLDLSSNRIEGEIPRSLGNCSKLEVLNMGNNRLSGSFPCHLKSVSTLRVIVLRSNKFSGSIDCAEDHIPWPRLQIVDLALNNLTGELKNDCIQSWKAMRGDGNSTAKYLQFEFLQFSRFSYYQDSVVVTSKGQEFELSKILTIYTAIDLSGNNFKGTIPDAIGELHELCFLNLSRNSLTGWIPSAVGNLKRLESLDLSSNNLTGEIPDELSNLSFLSFLNLSYNNLVGEIPKGTQLQSFNDTVYDGNSGLCGPPLMNLCRDKNKSESKPKWDVEYSKTGWDWQFIVTGIGYGVGAAAMVGPIVFWKQASDLVDDGIDSILMAVLPMTGLAYSTASDRYWELKAEDDEMDEESEVAEAAVHKKDGESYWKYCVFCSKLDLTLTIAIHDPDCRCRHEFPQSSSSSSSSYISSLSLSSL